MCEQWLNICLDYVMPCVVKNIIPVLMVNSNWLRAGSYRTAKLYLGKQALYLHYNELHYMVHMFHVIHNQQVLYIRALADVMAYATAALSSTEYVEPATSANKAIHYPQLYEELKTIM
jgi:hypothetical protein